MPTESVTSRQVDSSRHPVFVMNQGMIVHGNPAFLELLGLDSPQALNAVSILDLALSLDKRKLREFEALAGRKDRDSLPHPELDLIFRVRGDAPLRCSLDGFGVTFGDEQALLCTVRTKSAQAPDSAATEPETGEPAVVVQEGIIVHATAAFAAMTGWDSPALLHSTPILDVIDEHSMPRIRRLLSGAGAASAPDPASDNRLLLKTRDDRPVPARVSLTPVHYDGAPAQRLTFAATGPAEKRGYLRKIDLRLALSLLCLILLGFGPLPLLLNLKINNVPRVYLPPDAEAVVIDDRIREIFPNDQGMLFLFEGVGLYSDGFLNALDGLTRSLEAIPEVDKVYSVTRQDHISGTEDGFLVEPVLPVDGLDDLDEEERRQRAVEDRFARRALVSADGDALAVVIVPVKMDDSFARMALQDQVYALIGKHRLENYLAAEAGQLTTDIEQTREFIGQMSLFIPLTVLIGVVLIWLLFRKVLAVVATVAAMQAILGPTISLYTLFDIPFNLISSILPPLLSALTIAALVHLFNALLLASRRGKSGRERVVAALGNIRKPALFNALTTMAGFGSLSLSEIPPIKSLGLITAAGVGLVYIVVYHLLPPLFIRFDRTGWKRKQKKSGIFDRGLTLLFHTGVRHPVATLVLSALLLAAFIPKLGDIVVETNLLEFFATDHQTRISTEYVEDRLVGTGALDVVFTADQPQGLLAVESLGAIKRFQLWLESQKEVDKATSYADFIEEMHWGFHNEDPAFRAIPDDPELISQYLFIYDGTDIYDFIDRDLRTARITLSLNIHGASEIDGFIDKTRNYLSARSPPGVNWEIAGISRMFSDQVDLLIEGQIKSIIGAIAIIFALMLLQWRSVRDSLICMVPNLSPVLLIFIVMGTLGIWLDMATAMIASVTVGIAIDDTIHVYHGFIDRVRKGIHPVFAIARTYRQAGRAVLTTTIILSVQFLMLVTSDFIPIANFGLLTTVGLIAALLFDLILLPAMLVMLFSRKKARAPV